MRPDAARWIKPDWRERKQWPPPPAMEAADDGGPSLVELQRAQADLAHLRWLVADLKFDLTLRRLARKYSPDQPRAPAGSREGGRWTDAGGADEGGDGKNEEANRIRVAQIGNSVTDVDGKPYYKPGGHHEMPEGVYNKWSLQPETRKVFQQSTTGTLGTTMQLTPDGPRIGNIWEGARGGLHRAYNDAVTELGNRFIEANKLRPDASDMTPDQARALLKEIRMSEDPRIRDFNLNMRRIQRLRRLRGGGGDDD
ncbi:MAG TPA: hypothetical protein VFA53_03540 [Xanthobacteraceae bacterium]|nr:hypothetical protein [Xanthobacteraceae bacterium]